MRNIHSSIGLLLMLMLLLVVGSCAVVYISEGNTQDRTNSIAREKHIGVTDDNAEVVKKH